jgi:hypothetical protein
MYNPRFYKEEFEIFSFIPRFSLFVYTVFADLMFIPIFLILIVIFILFAGIGLKLNMERDGIYIDRVYLQIDDKLTLKVDKLYIDLNKTTSEEREAVVDEKESNKTSNSIDLNEIVKYIDYFQRAVERIEITDLRVGDIVSGDFIYDNGDIIFDSNRYKLHIQPIFLEESIFLKVKRVEVADFGLSISGGAVFELEDNRTLVQLDASLEDIETHLFAKMEKFSDVKVAVKSEKIEDISPILKLLEMEIEALNNLEFQYIQIDRATTQFSLENPEKALNNLEADLHIDNFSYRFDPNLERGEADRVYAKLINGDLLLDIENLNYGDIKLDAKPKLKNLFGDLTLEVKVDGVVDPNSQTIEKTVKYYSGLEELPVQVRADLEVDFSMNMDLSSENLDMGFKVYSKLLPKESLKISDTLPSISSGDIQFFYPSMLVEIQNGEVAYGSMVSGKASGSVDLEKSSLNLDFRGDRVFIDETSKMRSRELKALIGGTYLGEIEAEVVSDTDWVFGGVNMEFSPFRAVFDIKNMNLLFSNLGLDVSDYNLSGEVNGNFNIGKMSGESEIFVESFHFSEVNMTKERLSIKYGIGDEIVLEVPELETEIIVAKKTHIDLDEIEIFRKYVPLLHKYPKLSGGVEVDIGEKIEIDSQIEIHDQHLLMDGKRYVKDLNISGEIGGEDMKFSLNDRVFFSKKEKMNLIFEDYDINITALSEFTGGDEENSSSEEGVEKRDSLEKNGTKEPMNIDPEINVFLKNNSIHLTESNNTFISKDGYVRLFGDRVYVKDHPHGRGEIVVEYREGKFIVKATDLDENLLFDAGNFNGIKGGRYNVYLKGEGGDFKGIVQFSKLKVKNMHIVNNILAVINTVPALLTFSSPGFNSNGLRIIAGYTLIEKKGGKITLHELEIHGETVDISVKGYIDIDNNKINLKVDIATLKYFDEFVENIPIANYVLLGDDGSMTTRIIVKGALDEPDIYPEIHEEILSTPIELGKRFLNLPVKLLEFFKELNIGQSQNREEMQKIVDEVR